MGHIGYTPQFKNRFKVEGKNKTEIKKLRKIAPAAAPPIQNLFVQTNSNKFQKMQN